MYCKGNPNQKLLNLLAPFWPLESPPFGNSWETSFSNASYPNNEITNCVQLHQLIVSWVKYHNTERANKHKWKTNLSTSGIFRRDLKNFSKKTSTTASTISSSTLCGVESVAAFSDPFFELLSFFSNIG
ncbi:hypothetical protein V6N13_024055 [Hibiscus sabdariffa]|uniref:Uncharacterized protein n=1 Tax=Hibiscus sabdariffa TaxID=183260 RepID=A0ABR2BWH8_9ROSI